MPIGRATPFRKKGQSRSAKALFLAAVGLLGLVVAPLLHAEEHLREELEEETEAAELADSWKAGSTDPLDQLAFALEHAHRPQRPGPPQENGHGHSHGPASPGPHGAGALAHLSVALHAAPPLPDLPAIALPHGEPAILVGQLGGPLRYLVPEWSQGPPAVTAERSG
jgi:hypothetical protein